MSDAPLIAERSGKLLRLQFNRPASLNAIDSAMAGAFLDVVTEAVADADLRVIILSGAGRSFMAGGDIAQFSRDPQSIPGGLIEPMNQAIRLLSKHPSLRILGDRGSWEIRPAADLTTLIEESERRRKEK